MTTLKTAARETTGGREGKSHENEVGRASLAKADEPETAQEIHLAPRVSTQTRSS